jgi:hypothetical protein
MAGERTTNEQQIDAVPKKGVWRQLRENPYIFGLSMVSSFLS